MLLKYIFPNFSVKERYDPMSNDLSGKTGEHIRLTARKLSDTYPQDPYYSPRPRPPSRRWP